MNLLVKESIHSGQFIPNALAIHDHYSSLEPICLTSINYTIIQTSMPTEVWFKTLKYTKEEIVPFVDLDLVTLPIIKFIKLINWI